VRQLHLVGVTDDKTGLIVADGRGAKATTYVVPITDEVRTAVQPPVRRRRRANEDEGFDSGSSLSPREIQARLRSGRSVEQVAAEAGVGADWIERFAGPIVAEQRAILERALDLPMESPRRGHSTRPLGEAVVRNLLIKGVRLTDEEVGAGWVAYLYRAGQWVVSFRYVFRRKEVTVDWLFDLADYTVVALDRGALALGFVEPAGGATPAPEPEPEPAPPPAPQKRAAAAEKAPRRASARAGQEELVRDRRPPGASAPAPAKRSAGMPAAEPAKRKAPSRRSATPAPAPTPDQGDEPATSSRRRRGGNDGQAQLPGV
jgi:hypothetical protein